MGKRKGASRLDVDPANALFPLSLPDVSNGHPELRSRAILGLGMDGDVLRQSWPPLVCVVPVT